MTCEVFVLYFAKSSEITGIRSETINLPKEITSQQIWEKLVHLHPRLSAIKDQVVLAVRQEYVPISDELLNLRSGDEIAVIPPISGG
ncbi:molybdopterin synthase sulfur carrier subunit [Spea bombifrons]|uniref:molybdopterin synthase sulfur carrier subunit n=1 Tax=Spea bombifrons TaxID=233779 RepID=UPI00234A65F2|nr:molybdopterin synthase sulfur carrier subunit [Spea bombifrons]